MQDEAQKVLELAAQTLSLSSGFRKQITYQQWVHDLAGTPQNKPGKSPRFQAFEPQPAPPPFLTAPFPFKSLLLTTSQVSHPAPKPKPGYLHYSVQVLPRCGHRVDDRGGAHGDDIDVVGGRRGWGRHNHCRVVRGGRRGQELKEKAPLVSVQGVTPSQPSTSLPCEGWPVCTPQSL